MSIVETLETTQALIEYFSRIDKQFKLRHVELMLAIIRHPSGDECPALTQLELIERYNIKASTASRDIEYLGCGTGGLNLLTTTRLQSNRKINQIMLTEKGEEIRQDVLKMFHRELAA